MERERDHPPSNHPCGSGFAEARILIRQVLRGAVGIGPYVFCLPRPRPLRASKHANSVDSQLGLQPVKQPTHCTIFIMYQVTGVSLMWCPGSLLVLGRVGWRMAEIIFVQVPFRFGPSIGLTCSWPESSGFDFPFRWFHILLLLGGPCIWGDGPRLPPRPSGRCCFGCFV